MNRTMWDGINTDAKTIRGYAADGDLVAYYVDGHFAWTAEEISWFPNQAHVTISVLGGHADVADCETGDLTPASSARWVNARRNEGYHRPTIYCSLSVIPEVRSATGALVLGRDYDIWAADYDNNRNNVYEGVAAKQYTNHPFYDESVVYDGSWPHRTESVSPPVGASVNSPKWPAGVVLQLGNKGNAVMALQQACHNSNMRGVRGITVDGIFGPQTEVAVGNFQVAEKITADDIAGKNTRAAMITHGLLNSAGQANP